MPSNARRHMPCSLLKLPCCKKTEAHELLPCTWRFTTNIARFFSYSSVLGFRIMLLSFSSIILLLRLFICTWEGPWAFLAASLEGMDFQVDSLASQASWAPVALSQLWMVEEGFLLGPVEDSGHSGQGQDAEVFERSWLLVADLCYLIHCHPVLSCCLKCVWRTELINDHASSKLPDRETQQLPDYPRVQWKVWASPAQTWSNAPSWSLCYIFHPLFFCKAPMGTSGQFLKMPLDMVYQCWWRQ